ncbi:MAG TPA: inositol monophosphatase family protein [Candidatus Limnocylindrales bacterium]|nr:inositol monophosphatase family protein [Candidatus Limnocylindrales bacterium]
MTTAERRAAAGGSAAGSGLSAYAGELAFAIEVAERAGRLLAERYERVERIDYKSARDVVTEVDHLSEDLIIGAIRATYPGDAILAEESGAHVVADATPNRTWVIDPVDGTINYANGIPFFCVAIGLVVDGRPAVGVIRDPMRDETFAAASDGPATLGGRPIVASDKERLSDFVISMTLSGRSVASRSRAVRRAVRITRQMGSAALSLAYVANGRFDAMVQQGGLSPWDVAAAGLIAERAGAALADMIGGPWFDLARPPKTVGVLAAPPAHLPELLRLITG